MFNIIHLATHTHIFTIWHSWLSADERYEQTHTLFSGSLNALMFSIEEVRYIDRQTSTCLGEETLMLRKQTENGRRARSVLQNQTNVATATFMHQSNKGFYTMRVSLFLVCTLVFACSGVSSTGAFVGGALENQLKLLERKYGMHGTAQRTKKKGAGKKKTRINCKEQPLKPVCLGAKLKKLESQMKSYVMRKRVSLLETSMKSQFSATNRREDTVEKDVKSVKAAILKLEQRLNETLERGFELGSGQSGFSQTEPVPAWPLTPVKINIR